MDEEKQKSRQELEFIVMPKQMRTGYVQPASYTLPVFEKTQTKKYLQFTVLISLGVLILATSGYLIYSKFFKESAAPVPVNPIVVPEAPDAVMDFDKDGLNTDEERQHSTKASLPDSDGDGLSDGDEVNIYLTDPLLSDTDNDGFEDGREVARGYSPLIKISQFASAEELKLWTDRISSYKLHEPTPTTLKLKSATPESQSNITYTNAAYKYALELPAVLTVRESDESRLVGIYISGTNPEGEVLEDPINISIAVKVAGQTQKDWVTSQYPNANYEFLQEKVINGIPTIKLVAIADETCPQDKTFFIRDNTIFILTWTCNQNSPFAPLYEQISQSFKYVK